MAAIVPGVLLGMGNPLLDISASVPVEILETYKLEANCAILAEESHMPIFGRMISEFNATFIAGGATQNSIRVAQALLKVPKAVAYLGCIGDDENGNTLEKASAEEGVDVILQRDPTTPTGTCAVLITGLSRSLVTSLGAANCYTHAFTQTDRVQEAIAAARIVYTAGFFQTVCPETIMQVARRCSAEGKLFCHNLSAPFLMQVPIFKDRIDEVLPFTDILFGNETEALTYAETHGLETRDISAIALHLANLPKENTKPRIVVITQGCDPAIVVEQNATEVTSYPVTKVDNIVDTNGAGDAFVGGFLARLVQGQSIAACMAGGQYAASVIITQSGCSFPADFAFPSA